MNTGTLNRLATIQTPTESANAIGEPILSWATFATRWVGIMPLSGSESVSALASQSDVTHKVMLHYTPGLKAKMRLVCESRTFEIMSVVERGYRSEHELLVSEVTD
jgi:SPP1 family predicted phage head-tail adaptor